VDRIAAGPIALGRQAAENLIGRGFNGGRALFNRHLAIFAQRLEKVKIRVQ
jgi:hypothetical protein